MTGLALFFSPGLKSTRSNLKILSLEVGLPSCHVPAEIVIPVIQRYLDSYETSGDTGRGWAKGGPAKLSPHTVLAERAGIRPDTLAKHLKGRTKHLSFYVVDNLLSAMGQPSQWYEWPLLPFYLAADLSAPPPGYQICAREGCDVEFESTDTGRKFCTRVCGAAAAHGYTKRDVFCRNHHARTPENVQWRRKKATGRLYRTCVICLRERQSERVARGYQRVAA